MPASGQRGRAKSAKRLPPGGLPKRRGESLDGQRRRDGRADGKLLPRTVGQQAASLVALCEAQLTIFRRPDLILALSDKRGPPDLKKAVEIKATDPSPKDMKKRADTKLSAAFVLSGVGK